MTSTKWRQLGTHRCTLPAGRAGLRGTRLLAQAQQGGTHAQNHAQRSTAEIRVAHPGRHASACTQRVAGQPKKL